MVVASLVASMTAGRAPEAAPPAQLAAAVSAVSAAPTSYPTSPPARICGDAALLAGPSSPPPGAVVVPAGDNLDFFVNEGYRGSGANGTTYYFASGVHTLGSSHFAQIRPADGTRFVGAPGAVLDGQGVNGYAFTGRAKNVTVEYLTIQNFNPGQDQGAVNHDGGQDWTIQYTTLRDMRSVALNAATGSVVRHNCIVGNHQAGINGVSGSKHITIHHNEVGNNASDPQRLYQQCGCIGGIKLFNVEDAVITDNWVHDNAAPAVWGDTNAIGFLIEGNYIENSTHEGILFETGYNARIANNNLVRNAIWKGELFADVNDTFPIAAMYISESGGDPRAYGGKYSTLEITGNNFDNNWGGITLWEDSNRFCNTPGNNSPGFCPPLGDASVDTCVAGTIDREPYLSDCRWRTRNVLVENNVFRIDTEALLCTGTRCGENSIFSQGGSNPAWSPYLGNVVQENITFKQNNVFRNNTYIGNWHFDVYSQGNRVDWETWRGAPYNQDAGSTLEVPPPVVRPFETLWRDSQRATDFSIGLPLTLGTRFTVSTPGRVTALRFNETRNMEGPITLKLWRATGPSSGEELARAEHQAVSGERGWRNVDLAAPVPLVPSERYVVTYHTASHFAFSPSYFLADREAGSLTGSAHGNPVGYSNGLYKEEYGTHTFPTNDGNANSYFADVVFVKGSAPPPPPPPPPVQQPSESLWPDAMALAGQSNGLEYTLGTRVDVAVAGEITALRFHETPGMAETVTLKLWRATGPSTGVELASATYEATAGQSGWRNVLLDQPVAVDPAERYVVSYHVKNEWPFAWAHFGQARVSGNLTAPAHDSPAGYANGLYKEEYGTHTFPSTSGESHSFFGDVVFRPRPV